MVVLRQPASEELPNNVQSTRQEVPLLGCSHIDLRFKTPTRLENDPNQGLWILGVDGFRQVVKVDDIS